MTTIADLLKQTELHDLEVERSSREFWDRHIYMTKDFASWLENDLPQMPAANDAVLSPEEQLAARCKQFIRGDPIDQPVHLNFIRHTSGFVWEMKTADLRVFGAFEKRDHFIAVRGIDTATVKGPPSLYNGIAGEVEREIAKLGLEPAQLICTGKLNDVISNAA
jgi:hypothetical protein